MNSSTELLLRQLTLGALSLLILGLVVFIIALVITFINEK